MNATVVANFKAQTSLLLGIICFAAAILALAWDAPALALVTFAVCLPGIILGALAGRKNKPNEGQPTGSWAAGLGVALCILGPLLALVKAST